MIEGFMNSTGNKILITPRSLTNGRHQALGKLTQAGYELVFSKSGQLPGEEELIRLIPGCIGYLAGVERVTARVLNAAEHLRVISRNGRGADNVDLQRAGELDIRVCTVDGANARAVAELTLGLILALARRITCCDAAMKNGHWRRHSGMELEGKTLGLVGCGQIGREVARLALTFDMHVLAYDPAIDLSFTPGPRFSYVSFTDLLVHSDIISLHCPGATEAKPILDRQAITLMKRDVYLVNTARASLYDSAAVFEALEDGHIAGVALDVFEEEPPVDWQLIRHLRVVATPHLGAYTEESISRCTGAAVENLLLVLGTMS
jgi:D-3-phosphoglycerate dehydrogenase / 2-oxoglutarate reductase